MLEQISQRLNLSLPGAAAKIQEMGKVTPEIMMIIYLDEIAGRLGELQEKLIPQGNLQPHTLSVTDSPQSIGGQDWMSATLYNDGDYDVYLFDQYQMPRVGYDAPIKNGEGINIDFRSRVGTGKFIVCAPGESATVRIFRMW